MRAPQRFSQFQTRRSASLVSENGTYRRFLSVRYSVGNGEGFRMPARGDLSAPADGENIVKTCRVFPPAFPGSQAPFFGLPASHSRFRRPLGGCQVGTDANSGSGRNCRVLESSVDTRTGAGAIAGSCRDRNGVQPKNGAIRHDLCSRKRRSTRPSSRIRNLRDLGTRRHRFRLVQPPLFLQRLLSVLSDRPLMPPGMKPRGIRRGEVRSRRASRATPTAPGAATPRRRNTAARRGS